MLSCYGAVHGAHRKHLAETAHSLSPARTGPRMPKSQGKGSAEIASTLRHSRRWNRDRCGSNPRKRLQGFPLHVGSFFPESLVPPSLLPRIWNLSHLLNSKWRFPPENLFFSDSGPLSGRGPPRFGIFSRVPSWGFPPILAVTNACWSKPPDLQLQFPDLSGEGGKLKRRWVEEHLHLPPMGVACHAPCRRLLFTRTCTA